MDKGRVPHPVNSVELYLPWNNTWLDLPPLPDPVDGAGRMDMTRIMSLTDSAGSNLYLPGGSSSDWNTGLTTDTGTVWRLLWDRGSRTYSWIDSLDPELGR